MGGNASPLIADLTLSIIEFRYLNSSAHIHECRLLSLTCRFIDDLICFNCPKFLTFCQQIYPDNLPLSQTNSNISLCDYLDLSIQIQKGTVNISMYDKTSAFNFEVIKFPHSYSNIHSNIGYNIFYSQLIRFGCICSDYISFATSASNLYMLFIQKKFLSNILHKKFILFCKNYSNLLVKFGLYSSKHYKKFLFDFL